MVSCLDNPTLFLYRVEVHAHDIEFVKMNNSSDLNSSGDEWEPESHDLDENSEASGQQVREENAF